MRHPLHFIFGTRANWGTVAQDSKRHRAKDIPLPLGQPSGTVIPNTNGKASANPLLSFISQELVFPT